MNEQAFLEELKEILRHHYVDIPRLERLIKVLENKIAFDKCHEEINKIDQEEGLGTIKTSIKKEEK